MMTINKKAIYTLSALLIITLVGLSIVAYQYSRRYKKLKSQLNHHQAKIVDIEDQLAEQSRITSLLAIGRSIDNSYLNANTATTTAKALCDIVYREAARPSKQRGQPEDLYSADPYEVYKSGIKYKIIGHTCYGYTYLLISMLEAKGIPARMAVMVKTIEYSIDSHTTVEFYNGTKWLALDPTFNIMWKKSGTDEYLSYAELYDAYKADIPVEPIFIGTKKIPGKTIEEYYISTKDLLGYLAVAPATVFTSNGPVKFSAEVRPGDWDGYLIDKDGQKYNHLLRISTFYEKVVGDIR